MIFLVIATLIKQADCKMHHTARSLGDVCFNVSSEEEAREEMLSNDDLVRHILDGWSSGTVIAQEVKPETILEDASTLEFIANFLAAQASMQKTEIRCGQSMSTPKRTVTATIEGQIERARMLLQNLGPAFDRPKEISNGILCAINVCDVFIRIIENQQFQIEQLQDHVERLEGARTTSGGRR